MKKETRAVLKDKKRVYSNPSGGAQAGFARIKLTEDLREVNELDKFFAGVEGQDYACQAVKEYVFGIDRRKNPKSAGGVLVFAGAPAVGKTFMAERLAKALNRPFLRVDMSNHNDKESYFDVFGMNPSYKAATPGYLTKFVSDNPVCLVLLDEFEKAHHNVRSRLFQIFEGGEIRDLFMQKDVSFRDAIIVITTNVGRSVYEGGEYVFSRVPQSKIVRALKSETNPADGVAYFSDALVSRLSRGKIIMFNKLRPEILHRIGVNETNEQIAFYRDNYRLTINVDAEAFVNIIIYSQGGSADVRTVKKAVREFFEKNVMRVVKQADETVGVGFHRIDCLISDDGMTDDAKAVLNGSCSSRILVYGDDDCKRLFESAAGGDSAIAVGEDFDFKGLQRLDPSAAVIQIDAGDEIFAKKLFGRLVEYGVPAYAFARGKALRSAFNFYTDGGATDVYADGFKALPVDEWLKGIVKGVELSFITQTLFRTNKVITFETACEIGADSARVKIFDLDATTAIDGEDDEYFIGGAVPNVSFSDVIGAKDAKLELQKCIGYLKNYKAYLRNGVRIPRGILLDGAPGTGKTMLAKALAAEANVPFIQKNSTEYIVRLAGDGAATVRKTFAVARKYAPCILFIDEIDAIAKSRGLGGGGIDEIVNAFLSEMDGFCDNTLAPVLVVGATNFTTRKGATVLDEAFLRRFDRKIHIELPDMAGREELLTRQIAKLGGGVDEEKIRSIARRSVGWNLADLSLVVQNALRLADDGAGELKLTAEALNEAFESYTDGSAKIRSEDDLETAAYHEAGHAVVAVLLGLKPAYATITSRGDYGGYVSFNDEEATTYTKDKLLGKICVALAGRAAEIAFFGERGLNTGAYGDLRSATDIATQMIAEFGMDGDSLMFLSDADKSSEWVRERVQALLAREYAKTIKIINENAEKVRACAEALREKSSLDETALTQIITGKEG